MRRGRVGGEGGEEGGKGKRGRLAAGMFPVPRTTLRFPGDLPMPTTVFSGIDLPLGGSGGGALILHKQVGKGARGGGSAPLALPQ